MATGGDQGMFPDGMCRALAALYSGAPLTPAELAQYNTQRAAEMARAEARRLPTPQLDLPETTA